MPMNTMTINGRTWFDVTDILNGKVRMQMNKDIVVMGHEFYAKLRNADYAYGDRRNFLSSIQTEDLVEELEKRDNVDSCSIRKYVSACPVYITGGLKEGTVIVVDCEFLDSDYIPEE